MEYSIYPLTSDRWKDLEDLFGKNGACGGCWCMYWKQTRKQFENQKGEANRLSLQQIVNQGPPPGLLAYDEKVPVGWIAIEPRVNFTTLERSRILKPVDDLPVWSIVCFFIRKSHRRKGVTHALIQAAIKHAKTEGAPAIEAYPIDTQGEPYPATLAYTGVLSAFLKSGFKEVARFSPRRPIVRYIF